MARTDQTGIQHDIGTMETTENYLCQCVGIAGFAGIVSPILRSQKMFVLQRRQPIFEEMDNGQSTMMGVILYWTGCSLVGFFY